MIGGATREHQLAEITVKIIVTKSAAEFGEIIAAVGLERNMAGLKVLATKMVQWGHISLNARNVAVMPGSPPELIDKVIDIMVKEKKVGIDYVREGLL